MGRLFLPLHTRRIPGLEFIWWWSNQLQIKTSRSQPQLFAENQRVLARPWGQRLLRQRLIRQRRTHRGNHSPQTVGQHRLDGAGKRPILTRQAECDRPSPAIERLELAGQR